MIFLPELYELLFYLSFALPKELVRPANISELH